jgi:hypothetical protein
MKSKGFTVQESQQSQLREAKAALLTDVGTKLGFTTQETNAALIANNEWMNDWYMMGGRREPRVQMEAAWEKLKTGAAPETKWDRAAALQKAYTDITWDTRQMVGGQTLIRGVAGDHAAKIALANQLDEDWSARTWPLTSWAVPAAQISVGNWVEDGILMTNDDITREEVFAMYHAEPHLREKGLKVKGEYILDGTGALDSGETTIERIFATKQAPAGGGTGYRGRVISDYLEEGQRFHDQTGGGVDDYVLGQLYDSPFVDEGGAGHTLYETDDEHTRNYWQVFGFEEPPAALSAPKTVLPEPAPGDAYVPYAERKKQEQDADNPQRYALAQELKAKGLDAESVAEMMAWWHTVQWRSQDIEKMKKGLEMEYGGSGYPPYGGGVYPPSGEKQAAVWRDSIIPQYEQLRDAALGALTAARAKVGITTPMPTPVEVY